MCTVSVVFPLFYPTPVYVIHKYLYKNGFSCLIQLSEIALTFSSIKMFKKNDTASFMGKHMSAISNNTVRHNINALYKNFYEFHIIYTRMEGF
jgi:hypothetical protein